MPQCSDVTSMLHHSAICWWVTAPHAPNVKTPLLITLSFQQTPTYPNLNHACRIPCELPGSETRQFRFPLLFCFIYLDIERAQVQTPTQT